MKVREAMSGDVLVAAPHQSIRDAARLMSDHDIGALPVGENDRLVGMITDRDIAVRAVADGRGPDTEVQEVMSHEVKYCFEDDDLDEVATNMGDIQVRRLPVLAAAQVDLGALHVHALLGDEHLHDPRIGPDRLVQLHEGLPTLGGGPYGLAVAAVNESGDRPRQRFLTS